jgi:hypothetical protein
VPGGSPGNDGERGRAAPPTFLDPILGLAERIDRARMRLRPIRRDGLIYLRLTHYRGKPLTLADGTDIGRGGLIGELHLDNRLVRDVFEGPGGQPEAMCRARQDLRALAEWAERQPDAKRPLAYHGHTILAAYGARAGFEVSDAPPTAWNRLVNWYLRGIMRRWSPAGDDRLHRGRGPLLAREAWLSADALRRRYGAHAEPHNG